MGRHVPGLAVPSVSGGAGRVLKPAISTSTADVVCQLQVDYSARAYRRDPAFPSGPEIVDAAVRLVLDALRVRAQG